MGKLTDREISTTKAIDKEVMLNDGNGLYLRAYKSGTKIFLYRYKTADGKTKKVQVGVYPQTTLAKARSVAATYNAQRKDGIDPATEVALKKIENQAKVAKLAALQSRHTVNTLFSRWEQLDLCNRKDKGKEIRRMFEKDVLPSIGTMAVEDVKKAHVIAIVDALLARGVDRMAKMMLSLMRQMFRFAQDRDIIEADPTATIRKAKIGKPDTERDRVLSEAEIKQLYKQLPTAGISKTTECAIWIALSTGCRIGELLRSKWADVDLEKGTWLIRPEISKNGDPLTVYLSAFTIEQFKTLQSISHSSNWCYPNRDGKNHVCEKTVTKQIGDRQVQGDKKPMSHRSKHRDALILPGGKWTPHDLRRTAGTMMTALGVLPDIADRCLNHKESNRIRRTYLRHTYEAEKKAAWLLLGERLELLCSVDSKNVVTGKFREAG